MTEQAGLTPAQFHRHPGVDDWRVTAHGAEAVFRATSLAAAAAAVPAIVEAAAATGVEPDLDVRPEALAVRVPFRDDRLPAATATLAAAVATAAREAGLHPDPAAVQAINIYVAQPEDADTRPFWTAVLGYVPRGEGDAVDPLRRGPELAFNPISGGKPGRGRTHVDVFVTEEVARERVAAALAAGGRLADDSAAPVYWSLASPENHGVDIAAWTDSWGD